MARKRVEGGSRISFGKQEVGASWQGTYIKGYEIDSTMSQSKKQNVWQFEGEDGDIFEFYGNASIDMKMKQVPIGSMVWIKYAGKYKTKFGRDGASIDIDYDDALATEAKKDEVPF